jgi:hypothetical protein
MPWNIRLLTFVLFLSIPLAAQTISPAPAAGDPTVTIVTAPAATGATIAIFSAATAATCSASATSLALAPNTGKTVLGGRLSPSVPLRRFRPQPSL